MGSWCLFHGTLWEAVWLPTLAPINRTNIKIRSKNELYVHKFSLSIVYVDQWGLNASIENMLEPGSCCLSHSTVNHFKPNRWNGSLAKIHKNMHQEVHSVAVKYHSCQVNLCKRRKEEGKCDDGKWLYRWAFK